MIAKSKPTGNDVVDLWHLDCWKAEKVHQDAIDALQNCPADASELELNCFVPTTGRSNHEHSFGGRFNIR